MSETLPPPVPADLDLSKLEYMPLLIARLRRSKAWLRAKRRPELGFYMVNVWMTAWMEKPGSSLEDDDDVLADAAMCPPDRWDEVKEQVMAGFFKCADGRLYHPVLVEQALLALENRLKWRDRKRKQRGQHGENGNCPTDVTRDNADVPQDNSVTHPQDARDIPLRDGTGRDGNKEDELMARTRDAAADLIAVFDDARAEVFGKNQRRPWPHAKDHATAKTWLGAGASPDMLRPAFVATMQGIAGRGDQPPGTLSYFSKLVADLIAGAKRPLPKAPAPSDPGTLSPQARSVMADLKAQGYGDPPTPKPQAASRETADDAFDLGPFDRRQKAERGAA